MGHYLSEMVSDAEEKADRQREENLRKRRVWKLKKMIDEHGLEETLVRLFEDSPGIALKLGW